MADDNMWERVRKELASPWDWVAAGVGAAGGLVLSGSVLGMDGGTSAGVGALAAVSARKAGAASLSGRQLRKRGERLLGLVEAQIFPNPNANQAPEPQASSDVRRLLSDLKRDLKLFRKKVINNDQFEKMLNKHIERYQEINGDGDVL